MRLSKVEIWNYRSIKHLSLDLGDCTVIVGKNNSGKSNIIHAIDLVIGERWLKFSKEDFFDKDESQSIKIQLHFEEFSSVEIESIVPEIKACKVDGVWCYAERYQDEFRESASLVMELEVSADHQISKRIYYGNSPYNYLSPKVKDLVVNSVLIPAVRDHNQILKTTYDNTFFSKLLNRLYAIADPTKRQTFDNKLSETNAACKDLYLEYEERLNEISKEIIDHDGLAFSVTPSDPKDTYKKLEILLNDGLETDLNQKGSGIQSVIIIALFKLYSEIRMEGNALLLVEEPESFLHPHANRHMASTLRGFCGTPGVQVIITTHSPHYLLEQKISNIALISKTGKETQVKQVKSVLNEVKLKRELTESNLELFFSESAILVEGPSERILFPRIAQGINAQFDFDKRNISLVEANGKTNLDVFIDLCNSFEIKWFAIVDKDFSDTPNYPAIKKLNSSLDIGIDLLHDSRQDIERKLDAKKIHVLSYGEIENYYHKEWLLEIVYDLLETSGIPKTILDQVLPLVKQFNDPTREIELKQTIGRIPGLDPDDWKLIEAIINSKRKVMALNMDLETITDDLKSAFKSFSLTKPKIAVMLKSHAKIDEFSAPKDLELQNIFNRIFT
jgi:putative ATP-dependent endonuclease of OLD family